jgi:hypothetical protein
MGTGESAWLIIAFLLGVIAIGVLSNLAYQLLTDAADLSPVDIARATVGVLILVGLAYVAYRYDLHLGWRPVRVSAAFQERPVPAYPGLIWLLSLGSLDLPLIAIRYHATRNGTEVLRHCWVLLTPAIRASGTFQLLQERLQELDYEVLLHPVDLRNETIEETSRAVEQIYTVQATSPEIGLSASQIIADITGGNKPMSAGMVIACLPNGWALEYVASERDPLSGDYKTDTQLPVLIGVDFRLNP